MDIAHGGYAVSEVAMEGPIEDPRLAVGQMDVGVDQPRYDPATPDVNFPGALGKPKAGAGPYRFDPAASHANDCAGQRGPARAIDDRGPHQGHAIWLLLPASEQQAQPE